MTKQSRYMLGLCLIIVCTYAYLASNQNISKTMISDKPIKSANIEVKANAVDIEKTLPSISNPKLSEKPKALINTNSDTLNQSTLNSFSISDITAPDNLPEYLLNTPFTTLEVDFNTLNTLKAGDRIMIPLFSGDSISIVVKKNTQQHTFSTLSGVSNHDDIELPANLTYRKGSILGSIATADGEYRISKISGMHIIYKIPDLKGEPENDAKVFMPHASH